MHTPLTFRPLFKIIMCSLWKNDSLSLEDKTQTINMVYIFLSRFLQITKVQGINKSEKCLRNMIENTKFFKMFLRLKTLHLIAYPFIPHLSIKLILAILLGYFS